MGSPAGGEVEQAEEGEHLGADDAEQGEPAPVHEAAPLQAGHHPQEDVGHRQANSAEGDERHGDAPPLEGQAQLEEPQHRDAGQHGETAEADRHQGRQGHGAGVQPGAEQGVDDVQGRQGGRPGDAGGGHPGGGVDRHGRGAGEGVQGGCVQADTGRGGGDERAEQAQVEAGIAGPGAGEVLGPLQGLDDVRDDG